MVTLPNPLTPEVTTLARIKSWDADVNSKPIRGGFTGDSMLLHGAKTLEGGTIARIQNKQYARVPVTGCTVMPAFLHLSADYAVSTPYPGGVPSKGLDPFQPLFSGVPSKQFNGVGLGLQANTQGPGQERYLAKAASSHGHWYRPQTTGATVTTHVDGVQKLSQSPALGKWTEARVLTPGTKPESRIKFVGGSHDYDGMAVYRNSENRGWQDWDMSHSGFGSERFVDSSNGSSAWADQIPAIGEFAFHANFLGTNDSGMGLTLRTQYARAWAKLMREKSPNAVLIFARPQKPGTWTQAEWDEVLQAYAQVASEMTYTIVFDLAKYMPREEAQQIDSLHLNELGHEKQATVFHNYLTGVYATAGGGTGGGTGEDTEGPVIANRFPAAGVTVAAGGTQDFTFTITDASAIASMAIVGSDGRIIGGKAPELISGNQYGLLGVPWASLSNDPADASSNPITTWRVAARDVNGNLATVGTDSRAITVSRNTSTGPVAPTLTRVLPAANKAWVAGEPMDWIVTHPDGIAEVRAYTGGDSPAQFAEFTLQAGDHWTGNADLSRITPGATQYQVRAFSAGSVQVAGISAWTPFTLAAGSTTPIVSTITSPEANAVITDVLTVRVTYSGPALRTMELCANGGTEPFGILSPLGGTQWGVDIAGTALPAGIASIRLKFTPVVGEVSYSGPRGIKAQISTGTKILAGVDPVTGALGPETENWIRGLGLTASATDSNADRLDANVFAPLDMGADRAVTIGGLGDSIMFPADGWFVRAWAAYAASKAAERPVTCRTWDINTETLGALTTVQGGNGGGSGTGTTGSQVVFSDNLNRGGQGTGTELVGSTPQVGQKWEGPTGVWRTYNNVVAEPVPGVTPTLGTPVYAKLAAVTVAADHKVTRAVRFTTAASDVTTTLVGGATKANLDGTQIRITGSSSGTAVATLEVVVNGAARVVATFPAGTVLDATTDQFKAVVIEVAGTTLKGSLANQGATPVTVQGTLTANEVNSLVGWDRVAIRSDDARAREDLIVAVATVSTSASGGTGTLPPINLYNGGASGKTFVYHQTRIKQILPVRPDAIMLSGGMNNEAQTPTEHVAELAATAAAANAEYPGVPFFYVPENPRYAASDGAPASRIPDHAARQAAGRAYAHKQGWFIIDLFSDYVQQPDRGASWVEATDGKHPNTLGKVAMTNRAVAGLKTLSTRI